MAEDAVIDGAARRGRLAQRRKALGLTQEDLAGLLGIERSTVARWERGETAPLPQIRPRLATALRVSAERIEELLDSDPSPPGAAAVPRQLPAAVGPFTGRAAELATLTGMLDGAGTGTAAGAVVISAIGGTAGVGKTALALHWAHRVAGRFGDGQLYVNLRGFDPSGTPVTAAEAIRGFLDALGVPPDRIPLTTGAQSSLYRSLVADKRMLIVLDNARDEQQVRLLLPASPRSLVLVTSRNQLAGLAAAEGARLLTIDVLPPAEAVQLLTARVGADRAAAEPGAIAEIAGMCACLPLALSVAAARAAARPGFPLTALAAELRDASSRLDALDSGDASASVRSVFAWSYQQLSPEAARAFRLLGVHPGPDISVPAAASLVGAGEPETRRLLRELTRAHLISEHVPGRYAFHDLLRAYAASTAVGTDSEQDRAEAMGRVLDHYLYTARDGAVMVLPSHEPIALAPPRPGAAPERFADSDQALAWFEAEYDVLLAAVVLAIERGFYSHAWQIPMTTMPFVVLRGRRNREWAKVRRVAQAAGLLANDSQVTAEYYLNSLKLYRQAGNARGEAMVHYALAVIAENQRQYAEALDHAEQARSLLAAVGDTGGEAELLNTAGGYHGRLGDHERARALSREALALNAQHGTRHVEGDIWYNLGRAEQHLGNFGEAVACYERALGLVRERGDRFTEAETLSHLGDARRAAGELGLAQEAWRQALAILEDLGHPGAREVLAKLA